MNKFPILIFLFFIQYQAFSQFKFSGYVKDINGNPIPYATITSAVDRNRCVSIADKQGFFRGILIKNIDTLTCSQVNYQSSYEVVVNNNIINFSLMPLPSTANSININMPKKEMQEKYKTLTSEQMEDLFGESCNKVEVKAVLIHSRLDSLERYIETK